MDTLEEPSTSSSLLLCAQTGSVQDILNAVPVSRSVLERRFRKLVGRSPQAEIRAVQLKKARQLLTSTDLPLDQVARRVGFQHPEYLSVVFKRETGQTPGQFRRQSQQAAEGDAD